MIWQGMKSGRLYGKLAESLLEAFRPGNAAEGKAAAVSQLLLSDRDSAAVSFLPD
jgi:hypothetical protein